MGLNKGLALVGTTVAAFGVAANDAQADITHEVNMSGIVTSADGLDGTNLEVGTLFYATYGIDSLVADTNSGSTIGDYLDSAEWVTLSFDRLGDGSIDGTISLVNGDVRVTNSFVDTLSSSFGAADFASISGFDGFVFDTASQSLTDDFGLAFGNDNLDEALDMASFAEFDHGGFLFNLDTGAQASVTLDTWDVQMVPAPGSAVLLGLGGLLGLRRRKDTVSAAPDHTPG